MSDCELGEEEWDEEDNIEMDECDKCQDSIPLCEIYCTGINRRLCKECYELEDGDSE